MKSKQVAVRRLMLMRQPQVFLVLQEGVLGGE